MHWTDRARRTIVADPHRGAGSDPDVRDDVQFLREVLTPLPSARGVDFHRRRAERLVAQARAETAERPAQVVSLMRRRKVLAWTVGATAAAAAGLAGFTVLEHYRARPAYAATPAALTVSPPTSTAAGAGPPSLDHLADLIRKTVSPPEQPVEYLLTEGWDLNTVVDGRTVASAVIAWEHQLWRAGDGRARTVDRFLPPQFPTPADRQAWQDAGSPYDDGTRTEDFPTGFPAAFTGRPPQDPARLAAWLRRSDTSDIAVLTGALDLLQEHVLTGAERAALLRTLARYTPLVFAGATTDRAGRSGLAFTAESTAGGARERHLLVVAGRDPVILAHERMLLEGATSLKVRRPAVLSYRTFRNAGFVAAFP
jgi:hypothetical protein